VRHTRAQFRQTTFLEAKIGDCALKGGVSHEGEIGGSITEILAEAGGEHGEEELVAHHETEVLKLVGDGLEAQAVVVQGEIALESAEEFLLQEDDLVELVVGEEPVDLRPHHTSVIAVMNDGLEDVRRDGEEEPADDGGVDRHPVAVALHGEEVDGAVDVVAEVVLTEEKVEVHLPWMVVVVGARKLDGNVVGDGDVVEFGGGGRSGVGGGGRGEGVAGGRDGGHGDAAVVVGGSGDGREGGRRR
jgi:hypothetical protein